jgi:uncharacterized protein YodC (DUF2158 family)
MLNTKEYKTLERQAIVAALFRICDPSGMENLNLGDTVRLKSGGPIMTLGGQAAGTSAYNCLWFDGNELKHGLFRLEQLEKAAPEKPWAGEGLTT